MKYFVFVAAGAMAGWFAVRALVAALDREHLLRTFFYGAWAGVYVTIAVLVAMQP